MKYRVLGKSGLKVSVIGVGSWQLGGEWGRSYTARDVGEIFDEARRQGVNFVDTAECYGDHLSESLVGQAVSRDRSEWVIATKFGHHFTGHLGRSKNFRASEIREQLEGSLRALRTDYIDLYQYHSPTDEEFRSEELWEMVRSFVKEGKVRHIGLSMSASATRIQVERSPQAGIETVQLIYNRLEQSAEEEIFPLCSGLGLGVLARVPLASGYLSGKYQPGATFPANDVRSSRDAKADALLLERVAEIAKTEVPSGVSMASWALAWCLRNPAVASVIPGCKDARQVAMNAEASKLVGG